jgi:ketosteroid isomerase-like protein
MADDIESFSDMLRKGLGDRLDAKADSFVDMVVDDVVMEFPYAPPGMVTQLNGKAAIAEHLQNLGGMLAFDRMSAPVVHPSTDPDVCVLEFTAHGKGVETGEPYDQQYISVIRLRDGKIVHYRDYWNPLVVLRALRGAAVVDELIGEGADRG